MIAEVEEIEEQKTRQMYGPACEVIEPFDEEMTVEELYQEET